VSAMKTEGRNSMISGMKAHTDMQGDDILVRCRQHLKNATILSERLAAEDKNPTLTSLNLYNDILIEINAGLSPAGLLAQVHPNEKIRKDAEICEQELSDFLTSLSLDRDVYNVLKKGHQDESLADDSRRMLDRCLRDFRRAGVDKDEETRNRIKALNADLVTVGQKFSENIRNDRYVIKLSGVQDLEGLPQDYISSHKPKEDGTIEISTDNPDYVPYMEYAVSDKWRKELRHKYLNRGKNNGPVLTAMIDKRHQLAKLLDYTSFADYIVEDKMIKEAEAIHEFIDRIAHMAKGFADEEFQSLIAFKRAHDKAASTIDGHESSYLKNVYKKAQFNFDPQSVRPYFAYERVRDGLLTVTGELFGLRYMTVTDAKVWHPSVVTYDVYDDEGKLGRIFLDMHPREGKYKHAAQFTVTSGLKNRQYPEGALVCNFPDPKDGKALMEHREVRTMFHEFGHLLHHLFAGRQDWLQFSGVATEWDFVEAPSQLLEEWAWSPAVLAKFAKHYETNEAISPELVSKMRTAEEFGRAIDVRQQLFYAALSANYYDKDPQSVDLVKDLKELQARYSYYPYQEDTYFIYSFGHLFEYSAMYYTYMWSLSLAKDLFEPFREQGLMNLDISRKYRDLVLKPGGSKDAADLVKDFLGRPFRLDAFKNWLTGSVKLAQ